MTALFPGPRLEQIGKAMQAWRGPGSTDDLNPLRLREHWNAKPMAPSTSSKKKYEGPPRWKTAVIIKVARLVKRSGVELRRLLQIEEPMEAGRPCRQ